MEYSEALRAPLDGLTHELTHSWFGRGVMPSGGNAGWIDEAIADWTAAGFARYEVVKRPPVNLARFSPYSRWTPYESYNDGEMLLGEMHGVLIDAGFSAGMVGVLRKLHSKYKRTTITTPRFESFIQKTSGVDVSAAFSRYVYGVASE